jgi:hypothetical protein
MHHESEWGPRPERECGDEVHILGKKVEPVWPFLDGLVSINIMLLHILIPSILKMYEQLLKFRMPQTRHGQQKLWMLLDLLVGKHHSLLLEEEKRIDTSSARPENSAERDRVPQLFDLSDYSR